MDLCLYTDSVPELSLDETLDLAAGIGCRAIEIATGGQSSAPHLRIDQLLEDAAARRRFAAMFEQRGLRIAALNCSAWPLHPVVGTTHEQLIRHTIRLAGELGVDRIVTMSGCPGDGPAGTTVDWLFYPWPADAMALLERQWSQAIPFWQEIGRLAADHGVTRIAFELHPLHLVYNVPTLRQMRDAVGPVIGANLDPSHLFWQAMDPLAVIRAIGPAIHHVHLKDTQVVAEQAALAGILDSRPFDDVTQRAWVFRTIGRVHDAGWWAAFVRELEAIGYDGALSIENEDASQTHVEGVEEAARFILPILSQATRRA